MAPMETYSASSNSVAQGQHVSIPVLDTHVTGTLWLPFLQEPRPSAPIGLAVINSATATPQKFYSTLAQYLNTRGLAVVTYDYRGTGESGDPRDFKHVRMRDWMSQDVPSVVQWAQSRVPDVQTYVIGHSIGGHAITLGYGMQGVDKGVIMAAHLASTKSIEDTSERLRVAAILGVVGPTLGRVLGYVPGKKMNLGEDITTAAMLEWSSWSKKPNYFFDDPTMNAISRASSVEVPTLVVGATDDPWASPRQVRALTKYMNQDSVTYRSFSPSELGVKTVGHHGLARRNVGEVAWKEIADWLLES